LERRRRDERDNSEKVVDFSAEDIDNWASIGVLSESAVEQANKQREISCGESSPAPKHISLTDCAEGTFVEFVD
jgi:hypothetical protein